ncbi:heparanase [Pycnococcus provasolii]
MSFLVRFTTCTLLSVICFSIGSLFCFSQSRVHVFAARMDPVSVFSESVFSDFDGYFVGGGGGGGHHQHHQHHQHHHSSSSYQHSGSPQARDDDRNQNKPLILHHASSRYTRDDDSVEGSCSFHVQTNELAAGVRLFQGKRETSSNPTAVGGGACVNLDWWPSSKCDYGRCPWKNAGVPFLDTKNKNLRAAVRSLARHQPLILRVGGSLADTIFYNTSKHVECGTYRLDNETRLGYDIKGACLQPDTWFALHSLCGADDTNCRIAFGLNGLVGRKLANPCEPNTNCHNLSPPPKCCTTWEGSWDKTNAVSLMRFSKMYGVKPFAFELGNEIAGPGGIEANNIEPQQYAADLANLFDAIRGVWSEDEDGVKGDMMWPAVPLVVGYDTSFRADWTANMLAEAKRMGSTPHIFATHEYVLGAGADPKACAGKITPSNLDATAESYRQQAEVVRNVSTAQPWIGEAGGAYNSGAPGVTDAFMSSFWYLDNMATASLHGFGGWCRQTLVGGNYSLLASDGLFTPHPDFYAALLWRQLASSRVLHVTAKAHSDGVSNADVRVYAHCTLNAESDVTLLMINLRTSSVDVKIAFPGGDVSQFPRTVWTATALDGDEHAPHVQINGVPASGFAVPRGWDVLAGQATELPPRSWSFVVVHVVNVPACRRTAV